MAGWEDYLLGKVEEFLGTQTGKQFVSKNANTAALKSSNIKEIANSIKDEFIAVVTSVIESFDSAGVSIDTDWKVNGDGELKANIVVNKDTLRRESLYKTKAFRDRTGEGIDDILALFSNGYDIDPHKRPFGYWVRSSQGTSSLGNTPRIGAKLHRDANTYLHDFVKKINDKYDGACVAILNEDY